MKYPSLIEFIERLEIDEELLRINDLLEIPAAGVEGRHRG